MSSLLGCSITAFCGSVVPVALRLWMPGKLRMNKSRGGGEFIEMLSAAGMKQVPISMLLDLVFIRFFCH